jgi:hypothetical protein
MSGSPALARSGAPIDLAGGRATVGMVESPTSLNPLLDRSDAMVQLQPLLWAGPFRRPGDLRPEPWLVLRIPTRKSGDLRVLADGSLRSSF